jgi:hypothetical protein
MKQGKARFEYQLNKLETLITLSQKQENTALWLYLHDVRTPLFMLEGLCKLYAQMHNSKKFEKLKFKFKELEDDLGQIDYYVNLYKDFRQNNEIDEEIKNIILYKANHLIDIFDLNLKIKGITNLSFTNEIRQVLKNIDWLKNKEEIVPIQEMYAQQTQSILAFIQLKPLGFTEFETEIHELRRKLRWLSIYPHALQGAITLIDTNERSPSYKKYLTPSTLNSRFNVLPINDSLKYKVHVNKTNFLALSNVIANLGSIKDDALRILALKEQYQSTCFLNDNDAFEATYKALNIPTTTLLQLLKEANTIITSLVKDKVLEGLIDKA